MAKHRTSLISCLLVAACMGFGVLLASCSSFSRDVALAQIHPAGIPGAEYVGAGACGMCHAEEAHKFKGEPHASFAVMSAEADGPSGEGCEACHGPGSLHVQNPQDESLILKGEPERCFKCHLDKKAKFSLRYSHPIEKGRVSCEDCHDAHSTQKKLHRAQDINETCFECHADIEGPWTFPHMAVEEDGCTVCHEPHGSNLDKMLVSDPLNLCLRCHFQAPGGTIGDQSHTAHFDALTAGCVNCHQAVHGSNFNVHLRHP